MPAERYTAPIPDPVAVRPDTAAAAKRLVDTCAEDISGVGVSLTWFPPEPAPLVVAATEGAASKLELVSFILGEGPQTQCVDTNRVVPADLRDPRTEWADFAREALLVGIHTVWAFPLRLGAAGTGALTLYRNTTEALTKQQYATALAYATTATALFL